MIKRTRNQWLKNQLYLTYLNYRELWSEHDYRKDIKCHSGISLTAAKRMRIYLMCCVSRFRTMRSTDYKIYKSG